jgi:hypothetical protein
MRTRLAMRALALLPLMWLTTLTGCENNTADTAERRAEIERLENALGRLEFRVYELENTREAADDTGYRSAPQPTETPAAETQPDGGYDLTPVE